mmetsp:Transcript_19679/g.32081  ORF Transcript_19679/g.32081 Transcript_19679/m.32081 type:complete len:90 (-) Transcript_19679:119-388(-)
MVRFREMEAEKSKAAQLGFHAIVKDRKNTSDIMTIIRYYKCSIEASGAECVRIMTSRRSTSSPFPTDNVWRGSGPAGFDLKSVTPLILG